MYKSPYQSFELPSLKENPSMLSSLGSSPFNMQSSSNLNQSPIRLGTSYTTPTVGLTPPQPLGGASLKSITDNLNNDVSLPGLEWAKFGLGALQSLGGLYMGMREYGLQKKALKQSQDQWAKNYDAQRRTLNAHMEDRQRARVASNPNAYEAVNSYMDRNRIQ